LRQGRVSGRIASPYGIQKPNVRKSKKGKFVLGSEKIVRGIPGLQTHRAEKGGRKSKTAKRSRRREQPKRKGAEPVVLGAKKKKKNHSLRNIAEGNT